MKIRFKEFFYISNILSMTRLVLIIPFYFLLIPDTGMANTGLILLTIVIILTDFLDGYCSRKRNQVTDLGKILDPMADKIVMAIGLVALILYRDFPVPIVVFLIYRDLMIFIFSWIVLNRTGKPEMANFYGKLNTTVIALTVLLYLLGIKGILLDIFLFTGYMTIIISGISYAGIAEKVIFTTKKSRYLFKIISIILTVIIIYSMKGFSFLS
ncbi:MAG: CDP-alcohol phosphatidyltransferase family protein [Calditrichaceae bacterium]|nr:CDP-alcohol phosphatidyltransferase family protein [Calditrichaceae bacterium]RQV96700.1 MAG: CDP-alcohol phosphatidyltransferase family protein [Calditrichota bacterium]